VSINGKDELSVVVLLPSCPICRATMDLKRLESFGSRHISDDGKLYYIIVIIQCALLMKRNESRDCYPFHGIAAM
jgi:hypothetical protein